FLSVFLLYYYNQIVGLNAIWASIALATSILIDAISDPIIGLYSDYQHSEGKRRVKLMSLSIFPTLIALFLLFFLDLGNSQTVLFLQLFVLGAFLRTALSFYIVPREAIGNQIFKGYSARNHLWAANAFFSTLGASLALGPSLLFFITDWDDKNGYMQAAIWVIIIYFVFATVCLKLLKQHEVVISTKNISIQKVSLRTTYIELRKLFNNKSWLMLFVGCLIFSIQMSLNTGTGLYFNNYIWYWMPRDLFWGGIISLPGSILGAVVFFLINVKNKKYLALVIGLVATLISPSLLTVRLLEIYFVMDYLPDVGEGIFSTLWWIWSVHQFVENFLWTIFWILIASMFSDIVEEHQVNIGARLDGLVLSANNFINKSLSSFGIILSGILLNLVGFDSANSELAKQHAAQMLGAFHIYTILLFFPFALYFIGKYRITYSSHMDNLEEIKNGKN
ncbi:MFS transporter, partial [Amylibacter sp.]|nr:MFS transporter [Amylibacter sp.]